MMYQKIFGGEFSTNIFRMIRINKTWWLRHINIFGKLTLKKGVIDIQLTKRPAMTNINTKNKPYCGGLNNWTESVIIVHTRPLIEPFVNKTSFKPVNRAVGMSFNTKIHLQPTILEGMGGGTSFHVLLRTRASYSSNIA